MTHIRDYTSQYLTMLDGDALAMLWDSAFRIYEYNMRNGISEGRDVVVKVIEEYKRRNRPRAELWSHDELLSMLDVIERVKEQYGYDTTTP